MFILHNRNKNNKELERGRKEDRALKMYLLLLQIGLNPADIGLSLVVLALVCVCNNISNHDKATNYTKAKAVGGGDVPLA